MTSGLGRVHVVKENPAKKIPIRDYPVAGFPGRRRDAAPPYVTEGR